MTNSVQSGGAGLPEVIQAIIQQRPLIEGESEVVYDDLVERCREALEPENAIEWIWVRDVVDNHWEAQRLRRLRAALLDRRQVGPLEDLMRELQRKGMSLADLQTINLRLPILMRGWLRSEEKAVREVERILSEHGLDINSVMAEVLARNLPDIERFDRLIEAADRRRDRAIRELERRRDMIARRQPSTVPLPE